MAEMTLEQKQRRLKELRLKELRAKEAGGPPSPIPMNNENYISRKDFLSKPMLERLKIMMPFSGKQVEPMPSPTEEDYQRAKKAAKESQDRLLMKKAKLWGLPLNALMSALTSPTRGGSDQAISDLKRMNPFNDLPPVTTGEYRERMGIPAGPEFGLPEKGREAINRFIVREEDKLSPGAFRTNLGDFTLTALMSQFDPTNKFFSGRPQVGLPGASTIEKGAKQAGVNKLVKNIEEFTPALNTLVTDAEKKFYQKQIKPRMLEQEARLSGATMKINPDDFMGFSPELDSYLNNLKSVQNQYIEYPFGKFKKSDIPDVKEYKWGTKKTYTPKSSWEWYNEKVPVRSTTLDIPEKELITNKKGLPAEFDPITMKPIYREPVATTTTEYKNIPKAIKKEPVATTTTEYKEIPKAIKKEIIEEVETPIARKETVPGYPKNAPAPTEIEIPATEALKIREELNKAANYKQPSQYKGTSEPLNEAAKRKADLIRQKMSEIDPDISSISSELNQLYNIKDEAMKQADTNLNSVVKGTDLGKQSNLKRYDVLAGTDLSGFGKMADKAQKMQGKSRAQSFIGKAKVPYDLLQGQISKITDPMFLEAANLGIPDLLRETPFDTWLRTSTTQNKSPWKDINNNQENE